MAGRSAQHARHVSRRARSQHFLRSPRLAAALVEGARVRREDLVVEIGAGGGRLTAPLATRARRVEAIELDPFWASRLRARFRDDPVVAVVEGDVLHVSLPREAFRVVANLPFHCTTAILRRLLEDVRLPLERADVIVEWEVARKRVVCWPSTMLDVVWGARYEFALVRRLPAACFEPRPAADTGVLRIVLRAEPLVDLADFGRFRSLVERGFRSRAPTLRAALRDTLPPRRFKTLARELGFDVAAAARDLDVVQWVALFGAVVGVSRIDGTSRTSA